jgi:hypothetical protein
VAGDASSVTSDAAANDPIARFEDDDRLARCASRRAAVSTGLSGWRGASV